MKVCEFPGCSRSDARFLMGWNNENGKHFGLVCATHDRILGRINLSRFMPVQEAIVFERYLRETVNSTTYPDFPEWLQLHGYLSIDSIKSERVELNTVELLELSPRTHNALRRNDITTLEKLAGMSDDELSRVRMLGAVSINEIHKQLEELGMRARSDAPNVRKQSG